MTNFNFFNLFKHFASDNGSGMDRDWTGNGPASDLGMTQPRFDSLSLVSRQSVLPILLLCLTFFVGVGNVWGATFTKITSLSELKEGNYVIVGRQGASSWGILRAGSITSSKLTYTKDYSALPEEDEITTTTASEIWYLTVDGTNVKLYNAGQNQYLNPGGTSLSYGGSGTNWTAGYSSGFRLGYGTYYLGVNKDANNWCAYVSGSLYSTTYGLTLYKEKCSVTLKDNNETITQTSGGASITLPSRSGCDGYTFAGWTKSWNSAQMSWTTTAPTIIPAGSYTPTTDENLYPVYTKVGSSVTKSYGWETTAHADWTIGTQPSRSNSNAHTGSYAGYINTNHTYVQFVNKVKVTSFSFWLKRTSKNSNYNVYIETSTDGDSWTAAETYSMSDFGNGSYTQKIKTWDGSKAYYVRFHCYNTTAERYVDDVSITYLPISYISVTTCTYSITYHCDGATSGCPSDASNQSALPNPLPTTPTKAGYTFDGWYTDAGLTTPAVAGATLVSNADLYAKWEAAACSADPTVGTASLNGSFNLTTSTSAIDVQSGTCSTGNAACDWTDYGFVWSDGANTTTPTVSNNKVQVNTTGSATSWTGSVTPSGSTTPTSWTTGHTYYVRTYGKNSKASATYYYGSAWSFTPYLVTFNKNDGGATTSTQYVQGDVSTPLTSNSFSRTGYTFNGWNTDADGTSGTGYTDGQSVSLSANLTLYAKWNAKTTTISFNQTSGTGGQTGTLTATYGSAMPGAPVTCPTRTGYDFGGYYDGSGGSGTQYYTNTGASARNWDKEDATYTLHAKWTVKNYSVTWKVNNTNYTTGGPSDNVNHGSRVAKLPTDPDPNDYCGQKFVGWTDATDGAYVHGTSNLFTTAGTAPIANGAQIFYAVFADYDE